MTDKTVEHKLSIFLSSKCGGKYTIMRKALKQLLLETGLTDVYCFETEPGSSERMPSAYLDYIDNTQLFILIVDNEDKITDATLSEFKRAKDLGKRIIAIFCNEDSKEKTEIEKEIIEKGLCKFDTANSFSDIAEKVYKAVVQDLVTVYKKKEQSMTIPEQKASENNISEKGMPTFSTIATNAFINKRMLKGFDNVLNTITNTVFRGINNTDNLSDINKLTCNFLQVVLCNAKFKSDQFYSLKALILDKQPASIQSIIGMRLDAVNLYFSGNLDACINKLTDISRIALSDSSIPKWISNDIAIDLRNMINIKFSINGTFAKNNEGQRIINDSDEYLYFPVIDRLASNVKETAIKEYGNTYLRSPYTIAFGGLDFIFNDVALYFCTALLYGSITHIKIVRNLLIDILQALRQEYSDSEFNAELIRLLILQFDDETLENIIRTFNQPYSIISSIEIQKIINDIENLPLQSEQTHAKLLLLKHFGNYFSDKQFNSILGWLLRYLESLKEQPVMKAFIHNDIIKKLFINNCRRFPKNVIVNYVKWLFSIKGVISTTTACELISYLPFKEIPKKDQIELRKLLREVIYRDAEMPHLKNAILVFCVNSLVDITPLELAVKKKLPSFYEDAYYLEMHLKDNKSFLVQIEKRLEDIKSRIEVQSKSYYLTFADNPFAIIRDIIVINHLHLSEKYQSEILKTACEFLKSPNQSIREKIEAIKLIVSLIFTYPNNASINKEISKLDNYQNEIHKVNTISSLENNSVLCLNFAYSFLLLINNTADSKQVLFNILSINSMEDNDIIICLSFLLSVSSKLNYKELPDEILASLFQLYVSLQKNKERDIKYLATRNLILLANSKYQEIVLRQLSNCMDCENPEIKIAIVQQIQELQCDLSIKKYIIQKATIDNNYLVRDISKHDKE